MRAILRTSILTALLLVACAQAGGPDTKVYITKSGKKYHRAGCRYLSSSKIEITLADAQRRHFDPCKVCKPPVK